MTSKDFNPAMIEPAIEKYRIKIQSKLKVLEKLTGCRGLSNTPQTYGLKSKFRMVMNLRKIGPSSTPMLPKLV